ncbi:MAG: cystathionine beta-lyase [Gammaproteobacteria bacterium]|nr:MAG: PLP-dependent transferase [Pseudomonadota bacterium]MBC6946206.1 PLP-dependent transferase [Gammaproteobacteria bacterium]MCE7896177.1 PLP-dependent transferase [Gammaproteobacteria bacterium PRO8]MDL1881794.1 PLP-dependent transferase [Gammaproteobacteria bacterium PRO2]MCL4778158.1 PLP-dependent aspartate aminotransferase family protein [Gammaproteobacteria bacterium]
MTRNPDKPASAGPRKPGPATLCIHAGATRDPATGAVMPPIHTSVTFAQSAVGEHQGWAYSRNGNPTRDALERCLAELEGGARALAFASGMAATATVLELLDAGAHVIAPHDGYGGTYRILHDVRPRSAGLAVSCVDCCDLAAIEGAIRPQTRMLWLETPTNPLLRIQDLAAACALARRHGILTVVDNTFATPLFQKPLEAGADVVMHSATKYLGGHSDVLGGFLVAATAELGQRLHGLRSVAGGVASPFDSYLLLRGIKTLALRMERHAANAQSVAEYLAGHRRVRRVHYPGLADHPQHALARRQMRGFGGMLSFEIEGGAAAARTFLERLRVFTLAESLGGVESLAGYPAAMSHSAMPAEQRRAAGIGDDLLRLSIGIEDVADLVADIGAALG